MKNRRIVFRKARLHDLPACGEILRQAVERMLREGKHQWSENYPNEIHILDDISNGNAFVLECSGTVVAYAAVIFTGEAAYNNLKGDWLSDNDYVVVHRLAVLQSETCRGLGRKFLMAVEQLAAEHGIGSFRIDTNYDNYAMLHLLENYNFSYCGEIEYPQGKRMAFEKLI